MKERIRAHQRKDQQVPEVASSAPVIDPAEASSVARPEHGNPTFANRSPAAEGLKRDGESEPQGHNFGRVPVGGAGLAESLPTGLRARFERSLGEGLTDVRVHTGPDSSRAADQLSARAFTVGSDIHFGAGEYQPGSRAGEGLVAHELLHVIQQRGAPGPRPEVGPLPASDPLETQATALTSDLVRGAPVRVSSAPALAAAARKKDYNPADILANQAADVETLDQEMGMDVSTVAQKEVLAVNNIGDVKAAEAEIERIKAANPKLEEAIGTHWSKGMGEVPKSTLTDNTMAQAELGEFVASAGIQSTSLSNFQQQYAKLSQDGDRLLTVITMMDVSGSTGAEIGEKLVQTQQLTAKDRSKMSGDVDDVDKIANANLATKKAELRTWQKNMSDTSSKMQVDEKEETKQAYSVQSKVNDIAAGLKPRDAPGAVKDLAALKEKLEKIKSTVKTVTGFATKALGGYLGTAAGTVVSSTLSGVEGLESKAEGLGEKAKEKVSDKGADLANDFLGFLATLPWHGDLELAEARAGAALEKQNYDSTLAELKELKARMLGFEQSVTKYLTTAQQLQQAKVHVRRMMREVGRVADKAGGGQGHKWETMGVFMGESEAYLAQCTAAIGIGQNEMAQGVETSGRRKKVVGSEGRYFYWTAHEEKRSASDSYKWVLEKQGIHLPFGKGSAEGQYNHLGVNQVIADEMKVLEKNKETITQVRAILAKEFTAVL